ncbi:hypothetical protein [Tropicimonas sp.]|uniref:hypothetical protein n=1 Tax=Tropicimonas sp. TaxID=2067044 RepID=UPI003A87407D
MKTALTLAAALALTGAPSLAFDDTDSAAIATAYDRMLSDTQSGNYQGVFDVMPPAFLENMAGQSGMSVEEVEQLVVSQMEQVMTQISFEEASYDLGAAETGTSAAGRDYALIPSRTVMKADGRRIEATGTTLAVEDGGQWYLIRLETPQHLQLVGEVYPDLAGLVLPQSTMRELSD